MNNKIETDFVKLERAVKRLGEVLSWPDQYRTEASIQCFEFVIELYWKLLQHMLRDQEVIANTPMTVLKEAFAAGWIDREDIWVRMLKDRNLSSHTYNEELASEILQRIPSYLPLIEGTFQKLKTIG